MDAVHESQQPLEIGVCQQHNRIFQCYCTQCYCLICPNCLMFDFHKGHIVTKIEEGAKNIRSKISNAAKDGLLKFEKTQNVLLDIRHAKLTLEQNQENITKKTEACFDKIICALKARKKKVLNDLAAQYSQQMNKISKAESQWMEKQQISKKILQLQGSTDDIKIVQTAKFIVQGLETMSQPMREQQLVLVKQVQTNLKFTKTQLNCQQFIEFLKEYLKISEKTINKLKC